MQNKIYWPSLPPHKSLQAGTYMVTGGTFQKRHFFQSSDQFDFLEKTLFELALKYGWTLQAWAFLTNHYHFIAQSNHPDNLAEFLAEFHEITTNYLNTSEKQYKRKVWQQFFEAPITFLNSYYSLINYINHNPAKHKLVKNSEDYSWCSAAWFKQFSHTSLYKTVSTFKIDNYKIHDDEDF